MSESYINESRKEWFRLDGLPTADDLKLGCMQRIATACESMAKNHDQLVAERDLYERWYQSSLQDNDRLRKSNAALRGVIKRMKRIAGEAK